MIIYREILAVYNHNSLFDNSLLDVPNNTIELNHPQIKLYAF